MGKRWLIAGSTLAVTTWQVFENCAPRAQLYLQDWLVSPNLERTILACTVLLLILPALTSTLRFPKTAKKLGGFPSLLIASNILVLSALGYFVHIAGPPTEQQAKTEPVALVTPQPPVTETPSPQATPESLPLASPSPSPEPAELASAKMTTKTVPSRARKTIDVEVELLPEPKPAQKPKPALKPNLTPESEPKSNSKLGLYTKIDAHALAAPPSAERDIETLAKYLIRPARNEEEKVRAIYRWITDRIAYDAKAFFSNNLPDGSPEQTLKTRLAVCDGYSRLAHALGKAAGLEIEIVGGYARGYERPGEVEKSENHAWNAVKLQGRWHLFDSTWGAGSLSREQAFEKKYKEFYFLTPPDRLINTHRPSEERWQLLQRPFSVEHFKNQPKLYPSYYELGVKLPVQSHGSLQAKPEAKVDLTVPDSIWVAATLRDAAQKEEKNATFVSREGNKVSVRLKAPRPGKYTLHIFAGASQGEGQKTASAASVVEFKVDALSGKQDGGYPMLYPVSQDRQVSLSRPNVGEIQPGLQNFDLRVPGAKLVFVNDWNKALEKNGDRFSGPVEVDSGKVTIFAQFEEERAQALASFEVR